VGLADPSDAWFAAQDPMQRASQDGREGPASPKLSYARKTGVPAT
jgi:hypothetical protein